MTVKEYGATIERLRAEGDADGILDFVIEHAAQEPEFTEADDLRLAPAMTFAYRLGSPAKIQRLDDISNGHVPAGAAT